MTGLSPTHRVSRWEGNTMEVIPPPPCDVTAPPPSWTGSPRDKYFLLHRLSNCLQSPYWLNILINAILQDIFICTNCVQVSMKYTQCSTAYQVLYLLLLITRQIKLLLLPSTASTSTKTLAEVSLILGIIFPPTHPHP